MDSGRHRVPHLFLVAAFVLGCIAAQLPATRADAAPFAPCQGNEGVTIVVDATNAGGDITVRCALGPQANGWEALEAAGFGLTSPERFLGTAVCQIDGLPASGEPDCWETNVWWYSHAASPQTLAWSDSSVGARLWQPALGSVEGWKYHSLADDNRFPRITPAQLAPAAPAPTAPTPSPVSPPAPDPAASHGDPTPIAPGTPGTAATAPKAGVPTTTPGAALTTAPPPGETLSTTASTTAASSAQTDLEDDGDERRSADTELASNRQPNPGGSGGAPIGAIVGAVLILALLSGAGFFVLRRRQAA